MVQVTFKSSDGISTVVTAEAGESLMSAAVRNRVPGIEAACGGSMVCGTCHVYVSQPWYGILTPPSDMEREMHEYGVHVEPTSRLACQIPVSAALDGAEIITPVSQR